MSAYPDRVAAIALDVSDTASVPAKAAAAILTALDADEPPLRLPLGNDAADAIAANLDAARAELAARDAVTRGTDIDP